MRRKRVDVALLIRHVCQGVHLVSMLTQILIVYSSPTCMVFFTCSVLVLPHPAAVPRRPFLSLDLPRGLMYSVHSVHSGAWFTMGLAHGNVFLMRSRLSSMVPVRSESLVPEECSVEELESGDMKAICTSEGTEYIYRVSDLAVVIRAWVWVGHGTCGVMLLEEQVGTRIGEEEGGCEGREGWVDWEDHRMPWFVSWCRGSSRLHFAERSHFNAPYRTTVSIAQQLQGVHFHGLYPSV